ncbi:MAG: phosphoglycolate phosphatase [Hyphomicrobiales bacterium]
MTDARPLAVFDLDGTLIETAGDLMATLNHILAAEGLRTVALAEAREMIGDGAKAMLQKGFKANDTALDGERLERLFADFLTHYSANIANESFAFPGVVDLLDRLDAAGILAAVCTNKPEAMSKQLLAELGLAERFAIIAGPETFGARKPDPRHLTETIRAVGGAPESAVMIGDSRNDIDAARGAGVPVIVVDFGYTTVPVDQLGPDRIVSHFDEIWAAIGEVAPGVMAAARA